MNGRGRFLRDLQARWRFIWIVTRGFKIEVAIALTSILIAGWVLSSWHPEHPRFLKAVFSALCLLVLQPNVEFPDPPPEQMTATIRVVQAVYFFLPVLGVTVVAETLVRLGVTIMNREKGREEWQVAVAETMKDHTVVVGFGRIGWRVVNTLAARDPSIVVIEPKPKDERLEVLEKFKIPLITGDARREDVLAKANVRGARTLMALTDDDLVNIGVSLQAREVNPAIKIVVRMFDDHLATRIERAFDFQAVFSTSALAAPSFAAAVWNQKIVTSMQVGDELLHLARFEIGNGSPLVGLSIAQVEARHAVNVLLHQRQGQKDLLPAAGNVIRAHDTVHVVARLDGVDEFDRLTVGVRGGSRRMRRTAVVDASALSRELETFYDQLGDAIDEGDRYQAEAKERALALLDPRPGQKILEVGIGTGALLARMGPRVGASGTVFGIDVAESLLRRARHRLGESPGFRSVLARASATRLPAPSESMDGVLSTYVLDLLEEEQVLTALGEMRRVSKAGAKIVCAGLTQRGASASGRFVAAAYSMARKVRPLWTGGCRPLDLEPLARRVGLRVVSREIVEQRGRPSEIVCCTR